jgi:hypothetical protein
VKAPRLVRTLLCASLGCILSSGALAAPYSVQISEVEMNNNGLYTDTTGTAVPAIFVRGTFSPTLPCAQQGFFLIGSDPLFQSTHTNRRQDELGKNGSARGGGLMAKSNARARGFLGRRLHRF